MYSFGDRHKKLPQQSERQRQQTQSPRGPIKFLKEVSTGTKVYVNTGTFEVKGFVLGPDLQDHTKIVLLDLERTVEDSPLVNFFGNRKVTCIGKIPLRQLRGFIRDLEEKDQKEAYEILNW